MSSFQTPVVTKKKVVKFHPLPPTKHKDFGSGPSPISILKKAKADAIIPKQGGGLEVPRSRGPKVQRSINKNKNKS